MSFVINGISSYCNILSAASFIAEKGHDFYRRAKDFIYNEICPRNSTDSVLTQAAVAMYLHREYLPTSRNFLNGISATASYISEIKHDFHKKAKNFIYHKVLPHDTTILSLIGFATGCLIVAEHLNGHSNQYITSMGRVDDFLIEVPPGVLLQTLAGISLAKILQNRIEQSADDRTFQKIQKLTQNPKINQIALCLFCERGADHNGAFKLLNKYRKKSLMTLGSNHQLVRRVIRSAEEIITTFQEVRANKGKPISTLILYGHGTSRSIRFGTDRPFSLYRKITNFSPLLSTENLTVLENIPKTTTLFLEGCSNGKKNGLAHRIAENYFLEVFASPLNVTSKDIKITALGQKAILESTGRRENAVICYDGKQLLKNKYDAYLRRCKEAQKKNL